MMAAPRRRSPTRKTSSLFESWTLHSNAVPAAKSTSSCTKGHGGSAPKTPASTIHTRRNGTLCGVHEWFSRDRCVMCHREDGTFVTSAIRSRRCTTRKDERGTLCIAFVRAAHASGSSRSARSRPPSAAKEEDSAGAAIASPASSAAVVFVVCIFAGCVASCTSFSFSIDTFV
jgi:hypothetical protein